ncbi:MAG: cytochrome c [Proteobacteria bacterium]|nr:cytochrome c [Pseudomonadota bacterium]
MSETILVPLTGFPCADAALEPRVGDTGQIGRGFWFATLLVVAIASAGCTHTGIANKDHDAVADGKLVAQNECSRCHAIDQEGANPRADAPLFRQILSRYRSDALEDELVEGIKLGHPDMPQFKLNPRAVDDLIAYLRSIQEPPVASPVPAPNPHH